MAIARVLVHPAAPNITQNPKVLAYLARQDLFEPGLFVGFGVRSYVFLGV